MLPVAALRRHTSVTTKDCFPIMGNWYLLILPSDSGLSSKALPNNCFFDRVQKTVDTGSG